MRVFNTRGWVDRSGSLSRMLDFTYDEKERLKRNLVESEGTAWASLIVKEQKAIGLQKTKLGRLILSSVFDCIPHFLHNFVKLRKVKYFTT